MATTPDLPSADPGSFHLGPDGENAPPTSDALIFGRYRVLRELGRGGMGVVLLAHDEKLGQSVAIKMVSELVAKDSEAINDLRKEVLRGMALTHPNIARTNHFEQDETGMAIIMEFVEGQTLAQLMRAQPGGCFDAEQILPWLEQIGDALDYAHNQAHLAHRDLKPGNVMVTSAGRVKVADFGLASALGETQSKISIRADGAGTPQYMSPQQFSGDAGNRSDDIYSFGATLYALLTGKPPFFRGNVPAILAQVLSSTPPSMADRREELGVVGKAPIPKAWEEVVAACLAKDPAKRPQNAGEILTYLRRLNDSSGDAFSSHAPHGPSTPSVALRSPEEPANAQGAAENLIVLRESNVITLASTQVRIQSARRRRAILFSTVVVVAVATAAHFYFKDHPPKNDNQSASTPTPSLPAGGVGIVASKETPWENTLGMRFVPVPIKGGPTDGQQVFFSIWDTRVQDYEVFARSTKRAREKPSFPQEATHPVVNVTWWDAQEFCQWMTIRGHAVGKLPAKCRYRLPSDHEWSCAVGIGELENANASPEAKKTLTADFFPWGSQWPPPNRAGNYADRAAQEAASGSAYLSNYADGFANTSPVGSFAPNRFGIYDLGGNVWQWCQDWYNGDQKYRVIRGGSWFNQDRNDLLASARGFSRPDTRGDRCGFRCVIDASQ